MDKSQREEHWQNIYNNKAVGELGWYQKNPEVSLRLIKKLNLPIEAKIIDVGGGANFLVDNLIELGYKNITVLDISETALKTVKNRLGKKAKNIKWVVSDITEFEPVEKYDLWHDRAVFHFLTQEFDIQKYTNTLKNGLSKDGHFILGTFSTEGPKKCSGLEIVQYSKDSMRERFAGFLKQNNCFQLDHKTPGGNLQNFTFCSFSRNK